MRKKTISANESAKKRRTGGRSARVTSAVLDAALQLVQTRGISRFSVTDIATLSGVHETTIYRRWGSAERLILETLLERVDKAIPEPNTGSFRKDMVAVIRDAVVFLRSPIGTSLLRALVAVGEEAVALKQQYWRGRMQVVERVVDRAKARGELDKNEDGALLIQALIAPVYFKLLVTGDPIESNFPERIVEAVLRMAAKDGRNK